MGSANLIDTVVKTVPVRESEPIKEIGRMILREVDCVIQKIYRTTSVRAPYSISTPYRTVRTQSTRIV